MWLLKLHFAISILILITVLGFIWACKDQIIENGWIDEKKKKKFPNYLPFFVPILNVVMLIGLFVMVGVTNAMRGGMFHCGTDNMVFGYGNFDYKFDNEDQIKGYLQAFEDGEVELSCRTSVPIYDLFVK